MIYSQVQATSLLRSLGFRVRTTGEYVQALKSFQGGYNLGAWLTEDGNCGPKTSAALARSESERRIGKPTASANFSYAEFACTCLGIYAGCRVLLVRRELLQSLEKYRAHPNVTAVVIRSGYRCFGRNAAVGGAKSSQHMYGAAADIDYRLTYPQVVAMNAFAGIGRSAVPPHKVRHVDRRDVSGNNTTGSSVTKPMLWIYPQ